MENVKKIYLLYSCDEWKSFASMRLEMATTDPAVLDDAIAMFITDREMSFDGKDGKDAADEFLIENNDKNLQDADTNCYHRLGFGFVQIVEDGALAEIERN